MDSLRLPVGQVPLVFVDVETTGLRPEFGHRVCEIAVARCIHGHVQATLQELVNPRRAMDPGAAAVHGITDEMLADAPTFDEIADDVLAIMDGAVFVGHNAPFDLGFVRAEVESARRVMPEVTALDTLRLARATYRAPSYSLGALCRSLGIEVDGRLHRAMADVMQTRRLFRRLMDDLLPDGLLRLGDLLAHQGGPLRFGSVKRLEMPPTIEEALGSGRLLRIRYRSSSGHETERMVRPERVFESSGSLFLRGYCFLRQDERTFRVDRIVETQVVDRL